MGGPSILKLAPKATEMPFLCMLSTQRLLLAASIAATRLLFQCCDATANPATGLKEGDIIFQTSKSSQSMAIQLATHSLLSHAGILFNRHGKWYVLEAVGPVKYTPLNYWIAKGVGSHYTIKRLKDPNALTQQSLEKLRIEGARLIGKPYDPYFGWSDDKLYCSELIWKVYKKATGIEIGIPRTLGEFDLSSPKVKAKLEERFGKTLPLNERVITPSTIFVSPILTTVRAR